MESLLQADLVLWFFDRGFNVIPEKRLGNLRADIVAPGALFIEAKQHRSRHPKRELLGGLRQTLDTFRRERAAHPELSEAFVVVFRYAGPLVHFAGPLVTAEGWTLHVQLVDLAADEVGSLASSPAVRIEADEVLADAPLAPQAPRRARR